MAHARTVVFVFAIYATITDVTKGNGCSSNPCLHDGLCLNLIESNYSCVCHEPYTGTLCETKMKGECQKPSFNGELHPDKSTYELGEVLVYKCPYAFYIDGINDSKCGIHGWSWSPPVCILKNQGFQFPSELVFGLSTGGILVLAFFGFLLTFYCRSIYTRSTESYGFELLDEADGEEPTMV